MLTSLKCGDLWSFRRDLKLSIAAWLSWELAQIMVQYMDKRNQFSQVHKTLTGAIRSPFPPATYQMWFCSFAAKSLCGTLRERSDGDQQEQLDWLSRKADAWNKTVSCFV